MADWEKEDSIQKLVEKMVADGVVCGASLGRIEGKKERCCCYGEQGVVSPYAGRPVRPDLHYDLASLSKVVGTTTRILQLIDQNRLGFDTRIADLLPCFHYSEIQVEHLLLHDSGLPAEIRDKEGWNREHILDDLYATAPECEPGKKRIYSDVGFILLGKVVETLDHMTLEESYRRYVFEPLGMQDTSFLSGEDKLRYVPTECTKERGCICGTVHDRKAFLLGPCGSAGLFSTLGDVLRFVRAYLERDARLFGAAMFEQLLAQETFGRTYGWSREYGPGTLYHTGFTGTSILMDLEHERGLVLLTNRIHPSRENDRFLQRRNDLNQEYLKLV
ncbi:MAG: serine hydrolase [Lachnospiraceae bacterium]|nr:serine hydrolase [Lachnospiraceae bacterium]